MKTVLHGRCNALLCGAVLIITMLYNLITKEGHQLLMKTLLISAWLMEFSEDTKVVLVQGLRRPATFCAPGIPVHLSTSLLHLKPFKANLLLHLLKQSLDLEKDLSFVN